MTRVSRLPEQVSPVHEFPSGRHGSPVQSEGVLSNALANAVMPITVIKQFHSSYITERLICQKKLILQFSVSENICNHVLYIFPLFVLCWKTNTKLGFSYMIFIQCYIIEVQQGIIEIAPKIRALKPNNKLVLKFMIISII